jgi:SAM-dependent methyltransferase
LKSIDSATATATFTYSGRDNLEAMSEAHRYNEFLQQLITLNAPAAGTWLDFGAGTGQFAIPLKRAGHDVIAVEVDPVLCQGIARQGLRTFDALDKVPDESVDYIYAMNVLEHIAEDGDALRLMHRKLRSGGKLLIYVPAFQGLYSSMDALVGHYRRYRRDGLQSLVAQAGFEVESVAYADVVGYFASLVYKCLPGRDGTITPGSVALYDRWVFPISRGLDRVASPWLGKNVYAVAHKK